MWGFISELSILFHWSSCPFLHEEDGVFSVMSHFPLATPEIFPSCFQHFWYCVCISAFILLEVHWASWLLFLQSHLGSFNPYFSGSFSSLVYLSCICWFTLLFSHQVVSDSKRPHELQHIRLPCSSLSSHRTDVHWVGDAIQPSHPLPPLSPIAFSLSQQQVFFQWVGSLHQVAKVLELPQQSFQWIFRFEFL